MEEEKVPDEKEKEKRSEKRRELRLLRERKNSFARSLEAFLSKKNVETTLMAIVCDVKQCELFRLFLCSRFMVEGLDLLLAVLDFEMRPSLPVAAAIYSKFLRPDAVDGVAIDGEAVAQVLASLESKKTPDFYNIKADVLVSLSLALPDYLTYAAQLPRVESVFQDEEIFGRVLHHAKAHRQEKKFLLLRDVMQLETLHGAEKEAFADEIQKAVSAIPELANMAKERHDCCDRVKSELQRWFVFDFYPGFLSGDGDKSPDGQSPLQSGSATPIMESPKMSFFSLFKRKAAKPVAPSPRPTLVSERAISNSERRNSYTMQLQQYLTSTNESGKRGKGGVQITLLSVVSSEEQCELFREFLKSRFMDEQLNALLALLEFELVPSPENGKIIFERFIADGAPEEVTMAADLVASIRVAVEQNKVPNFNEIKCNILISLSLVLAEFLDKYKMPTVEDMLHDDRLLPFAASCNCRSMILFFNAAVQYEHDLATFEERKRVGTEIMHMYLMGQVHQISISHRTRKQLEIAFEAGEFHPDLFAAAVVEVRKGIIFDLYPRFLGTYY